MKALLDTDMCVFAIRKKSQIVLGKLQEFEAGELSISSITHAELLYGAYKSNFTSQALTALELFLAPLLVVDFGSEAAHEYGRIRALLERQGNVIGAVDMFIAAHALQLGVPLVTNNTKEFSRIPSLLVENWLIP